MSEAAEWLKYARRDMAAAMLLADAGMCDNSVNLCQQCIEKAFKAILTYNGIEPRRTHNLIQLANAAGLLSAMSEAQQDLLGGLTTAYIDARYPTGSEREYDRTYCEYACKESEAMLLWIENMLSLRQDGMPST